MTGVLTLYRSSIGKKVVMAVTGFILAGFVVIHMIGNLKLFQGPEHLNAYAGFLRTVGYPLVGEEQLLWIARIVLLASVVLHIWSATQLALQSRASTMSSRVSGTARYAQKTNVQSSYASRTMRWGGVIIFLFIVFHLLHLTFGAVGYGAGQYLHPENGEYQTYANVVNGFRVWPVSLFYIAAMIPLGMHLYHGVWSIFQTLGLNNQSYNGLFRGIAVLVALAVTLGNISFPVAVMLGIVTL